MTTPGLLPCPGASGTHSAAAPQTDAAATRCAASPQTRYLMVLTWAFTAFNGVRVLSYLPTLWAIQKSGDSSQHSLITWLTWLGANLTMSLWLYENNQRRCSKAVLVNAGNAAMCLITSLLIAWHRF